MRSLIYRPTRNCKFRAGRSPGLRRSLQVAAVATGLLAFAGGALAPRAVAHGVEVDYQETAAVELRATYAGGTPMAEAQVTVFAPDAPTEPWLQGRTDAAGRFIFGPDANRAGNWQVRVRQAGHGKIITIPIDGDRALGSGTSHDRALQSNYTPLQKFAMGGLGVWGAVGTALYFSRTPRKER